MAHQRPRHWIFDLDGTLTRAVHDFDALRRRLGFPARAPILETIAARPIEEQPALLAAVAAWEAEAIEHAEVAPNALKLLEFLAKHGCRAGILTRNLKALALATLARAGLAGHFTPEDVVGRDEAPPKPDPGGIWHLLRRWGAAPEDAVMVGDYLFDLEAGRRAGVMTIHVGAAPGWPEWTDWRIDDLGELIPPTS